MAGRKNGELLSRADQAGYEVFVTLDQGFEYEQNLRGRKIAIVIVRARTGRLADLLPLVPEILKVLSSLQAVSSSGLGAESGRRVQIRQRKNN